MNSADGTSRESPKKTKRKRRRHFDRSEWLLNWVWRVSYGVAVVIALLLLLKSYPWWLVLLALPLVLIAGLGFMGFVSIPLLIPVLVYEKIVERFCAGAKSTSDLTKHEAER